MAKDDRKVVTRERILNAAFEQFARHGFERASVAAIATHAGVAHGTVFWHFGHKPAVYAATLRIAGQRFLYAVHHVHDANAPFKKTAENWIGHLQSNSPISRLLRTLGSDHHHQVVAEAIAEVNSRFADFWRDWLDGRPRNESGPDATILAHTIVATLAGMAIVRFEGEFASGPSLDALAHLVGSA